MLGWLPVRNNGRAALPCLLPPWAVLLFVLLCWPVPFARAGGGVDASAVSGAVSRSGMTLLAERSVFSAGGTPAGTVALAEAATQPAADANARGLESAGAVKAEPAQPVVPAGEAPEESNRVSGTGKSAPKKPAAQARDSIRLFNTVEFRGELKNMPKWQRVVSAEQKKRTFDREDLNTLMRGNLHKQWLQLVERMENASTLEKAKAVSAFFNRWPYRTDLDVYKLADYWATPAEFLARSGDCEDYAITKFYALLKLGVDPESMRVVALRDSIRNLAHAVLVIYTDNEVYVLDNLTDLVLSHKRYQHYWPQYSINEAYRWAHVRPKKK